MTQVEDKEAEEEVVCLLVIEEALDVTVVKTPPKEVVPALTLDVNVIDVDAERGRPE